MENSAVAAPRIAMPAARRMRCNAETAVPVGRMLDAVCDEA
jgi:hypothetical protein